MLRPKFPETDPGKATVLMGDYSMFDILYFAVYRKHSTYKKKKSVPVFKKVQTPNRTDAMCIWYTINKIPQHGKDVI